MTDPGVPVDDPPTEEPATEDPAPAPTPQPPVTDPTLEATGTTATAQTDLGAVVVETDGQDAVPVDGATTDLSVGLPTDGTGEVARVTDEGTALVTNDDGAAAAVQTSETSVRVIAVAADEEQAAALRFPLAVSGAEVHATADGRFEPVSPDGLVQATVSAPWARDAAGTALPTSYDYDGATPTQTVDTSGAVFPVVADPAISKYARPSKRFQGVSLRTRGFIPDNCLDHDIPCVAGSGRFKAECTAQAYAIKELSGMRLNWFQRNVLGQKVAGSVDWEVGPYDESESVQQSTCSGDTYTRWRVDIVTDGGNIIEVKEWNGPSTVNDVQNQLTTYRNSAARNYGINFRLENDLTAEKWAWCYQDSGMLPWTVDTWCAWAGAPGEVYFKRLDDLNSAMRSAVWKRYQGQRGLPSWFSLPGIPVFDPVLPIPVA